jgi:hypothetical protein
MTIIDLIKASCAKKEVDEKYVERIQKTFKIEKPDGIDDYVEQFKANILPAIQEAEEAAKKAAEAAAVAEYEKKHNLKDGKVIEQKKDPDPKEPDLTKLSPEIKALIESQQKQIGELSGMIKEVVIGQQKSQKIEMIRTKLKGKVDDEFLEETVSRVNLDAENLDNEIAAQVKAFGEMKKKFIAKAVAEGNYVPTHGGGGTNDAEFDNYLKAKDGSAEKKSEFEAVKF